MGFFDRISKNINTGRKEDSEHRAGLIDYGENKKDGDHDHRRNKGGDRTPAQKKADQDKKKAD